MPLFDSIPLRRLLKIAAVSLLFLFVTGAVRAQSALDGFDPNANGTVWVVVVQPDGKILLGGDFTMLSPNGGAAVTRNHMARLNPDGTLDTGFDPNANNSVRSMVVQADGRILVGGFFSGIGGQARNCIARLDPATGLADSLDPNANGPVYAIAVQADGKILAGGDFQGIGGQPRNRIARLDPATGLADSFDPNASSVVLSVAVQTDGKILVGGVFWGFNSIGHQARYYIARLDPATGLADSFNPFPDNLVLSIAVQADGRILVGGGFSGIGGQTRHFMARLDPTTGLADSFDPNANEGVLSIVVQRDGKILAGGYFTGIGGQVRNHIARLDATTGLADSFDPNAAGSAERVYSIAQQADGKVLIGGDFLTVTPNGGATVTRNRIARLERDGRLDQTLIPSVAGQNSNVFITIVQPDGKILIGGNFATVLGVARNNIARLNADGTLDPTFNPDANGFLESISVQADRKILIGGNFSMVSGQPRLGIARLDPTTGLPDSFNPNPDGTVHMIVVQPDGKILVAGGFNTIGGQTRYRIARLDATGMADSFDPNPSGLITAMAVQPDGKVLVSGNFHNIGGQVRNYIARLDGTTGLADSFHPPIGGLFPYVNIIVLQADGRILVGGLFTDIGGQTRRNIARLDPTTGLADSFNPNANLGVELIALQTDGKVLVGGHFNGPNSIGGQERNCIARLDATTGVADSFNPNASNSVYSLALQADGKILAGGSFATIGGQSRNLLARLGNDTAAREELALTQTSVTWVRSGSNSQFTRALFEYSTDSVNYTPLGDGIATGTNWILTGLTLSTGQNFYIRARGYYRTGRNNASDSIAESVRNVFFPAPSTLGNISTRLRVLSADNVLIGGMVATGTGGTRVILRAIGPSLTNLGIPGGLENPTLDLFQGSTLLMSNDDWQNSSQQAEIAASGFAPSNAAESAIIWTLMPGQGYTAIVRGTNGTTGVGVVEAYDLDHSATSKLGNISTRGFVDVDDNVMIAGVIVGPGNGTSARILARALGPTLSDLGVPGALADTTLDLVNSSGTVVRSNDNWQDDPSQSPQIQAAGLAPSHLEEAALVEIVPPGAYTAIVRGSNRTTGVGLVEVYHIP